jgi:hypothetical protein
MVSFGDFCSTVRLSISSLLLVLIKRRRGGPTTGWKSNIGNKTGTSWDGELHGWGKKKSEIKKNQGGVARREPVQHAVGVVDVAPRWKRRHWRGN